MAEDISPSDRASILDDTHNFKKASLERRIGRVEELLKRFDLAPHKTESDAADAAIALENLEYGKHYLLRVISSLEKNNPHEARILVHSLEFITHGFFAGLSRAAVSQSSLRYADLARAEDARSQKKMSPREQIIDAAIDEALSKHSDISSKYFKIAGKIADRLNIALKSKGHKSVSIDALGKRISRKTPS